MKRWQLRVSRHQPNESTDCFIPLQSMFVTFTFTFTKGELRCMGFGN